MNLVVLELCLEQEIREGKVILKRLSTSIRTRIIFTWSILTTCIRTHVASLHSMQHPYNLYSHSCSIFTLHSMQHPYNMHSHPCSIFTLYKNTLGPRMRIRQRFHPRVLSFRNDLNYLCIAIEIDFSSINPRF